MLPALPFDGMNERGLVVGMAAVPDGNMPPDPGKETIDSLQVIRRMLDQASTVDEAVAIMQQVQHRVGQRPAAALSHRGSIGTVGAGGVLSGQGSSHSH